jgi:hypothetical protein
MKSTPLAVRSRLVALAILSLAAVGVQAQSRYVLSTLKAPSTHPLNAVPFPLIGTYNAMDRTVFAIDASDQVYGLTDFNVRKYLDQYGHVNERFERALARWPAGTGSSVAAVKLLPSPEVVYRQRMDGFFSRDASQFSVSWSDDNNAVYNIKTGKLGAQGPAGFPLDVSNNGEVLMWLKAPETPLEGGGVLVGQSEWGVWSEAKGLAKISLQPPQYQVYWASLESLNTKGQIAGVQVSGDGQVLQDSRASMWTNGVPRALESRPGIASESLQINEAGQVLARSFQLECKAGFSYCVNTHKSQGLIQAGVFTPITSSAIFQLNPAESYESVTSRGLTAQGVVFGNYAAVGGYRAFFWKNGVFTDVTDLVKRKGVSLVLGNYVSDVVAMNDKGSMVAELTNKYLRTTSLVRLTAQP